MAASYSSHDFLASLEKDVSDLYSLAFVRSAVGPNSTVISSAAASSAAPISSSNILDTPLPSRQSSRPSISPPSNHSVPSSLSPRSRMREPIDPLSDPSSLEEIAQSPNYPSESPQKDHQSPHQQRQHTHSSLLPFPAPHAHSSPADQALYFSEYLRHRRPEVRIASLQALHDLFTSLFSSDQQEAEQFEELEPVLEPVIALLVSCLELHASQEERFNFLILDVLSTLGPAAALAAPALVLLLRDESLRPLYEAIVRCIFRMGPSGLETLLNAASDLTSKWDTFALTHIANHPLVLQRIVVPALARECLGTEPQRKSKAVRALAHLFDHASKALGVLYEILLSGSVERKQVVQAMRCVGADGEKLLIYLLSHSTSPRTRACAAFALGTLLPANPPILKVIVHTDFVANLSVAPQVIYFPDDSVATAAAASQSANGAKEQSTASAADINYFAEDRILFDARELIASMRRGLAEGLFNDPFPADVWPSSSLFEIVFFDSPRFINSRIHGSKLALSRAAFIVESSSGAAALSSSSATAAANSPQNASAFIPNPFNSSSTSSTSPRFVSFNPQLSSRPSSAAISSRSSSPLIGDERDDASQQSSTSFLRVSELSGSIVGPIGDGSDGSERQRNGASSQESDGHQSSESRATLTTSAEIVVGLVASVADPEEVVRIAAVCSLGEIGLPAASTAVPALIGTLHDSSPKVRAEAAESLRKLGPAAEFAVPQLTALLRDSFWKVRFSALRSLASYGEHALASMAEVSRGLRDASLNRAEAANCLAAMGVRGEAELVAILMDSQANAQVRMCAATGLASADVTSPLIDRVVESMFQAAHDRTPLVRKTVLESLGALGRRASESVTHLRAKSLLPFLYGFLKDRERAVRDAAAFVMAKAGPHGELLLIEGLLKDANTLIRTSAAHGLSHVGPKTIRTLLLALHDREIQVRDAAAASIEEIGAAAIVHTLKSRPTSHRDSVVHSAREILQSPVRLGTVENVLKTIVSKLGQ